MTINGLRGLIAVISAAWFLAPITETAFGQKEKSYPEFVEYNFERIRHSESASIPQNITKKPGHYTITDWQNSIDSTWGWGLPRQTKLDIIDDFWGRMDGYFACFVGHPDYTPNWWYDLGIGYYNEILNGDPTYGVSKGRFAAIMSYLSMALMETHTHAEDISVTGVYSPPPGMPILFVGAWGEDRHFGAGLTPLPDSSLLVYKAIQNHPLGLVPGDIVLGYDGIPWKDLYPDLIDAQLPIAGFEHPSWSHCWGSGEQSITHAWLMAAGANWHLFDTLDVVKYNTGDTLHLPTNLMVGHDISFWGSEQLDVPGVSQPDIWQDEMVTFGIISGTQIGYIYVYSWSGSGAAEEQFYNAVRSLMYDYETTGLILDIRLNYGGGIWRDPMKGLSLLFNTRKYTIDQADRCNTTNHLDLCPFNRQGYYIIDGTANSYYDRPIAVLIGPGAISMGDQFPLWMKSHPMTRFFGKPTMGAYTGATFGDLGNNYYFGNAVWNTYMHDNPGSYIARYEIDIDDEVWLTPVDVALGYDTVVEAAKAWINSLQSNYPDIIFSPESLNVTIPYGTDSATAFTITNDGSSHLFYSLTPQIDSADFYGLFQGNPYEHISGHGGYDDYGYCWIDSDQPHGPEFEWVDISGTGTPASLSDESYVGPLDIGFDFSFYGNNYSQLYICSNGFITFDYYLSAYYINASIPSSSFPNNFIAPWWNDLNPSAGGQVYYFADSLNSRFIVSYVNVPLYSYDGSFSFEVILYADGQIAFNYLDMSPGTTYPLYSRLDAYYTTVGIENIDGSDGLEIIYNEAYVHDSLSIIINTDWLAATPYSGYIAPGDYKIASITFSAKHLALGTYTGDIYLDSNDPVDSLIIIPVSLTVTGGCDYITGDVNGSDSYNGLDIIYGVNYFKGEDDPLCPFGSCAIPPCDAFFYCGDVNGSCSYNGLDITYGVAYFKGGPDPIPCPDCPPVE